MGDELKPCPFCGGTDIVVTKTSQQVIDIYADEEQEALDHAMQMTAVCQCNRCFARTEDWARMIIPSEIYSGFNGTGAKAVMHGDHIRFLDALDAAAKGEARARWNDRV